MEGADGGEGLRWVFWRVGLGIWGGGNKTGKWMAPFSCRTFFLCLIKRRKIEPMCLFLWKRRSKVSIKGKLEMGDGGGCRTFTPLSQLRET